MMPFGLSPGTPVTVKATPVEDYRLESWSNGTAVNADGTNTFFVNETMTVTANFALAYHTVTLASNDATMGTVTVEPSQLPQGELLATINSANYHEDSFSDFTAPGGRVNVQIGGYVEDDRNDWGFYSSDGTGTMTFVPAEGYTISHVDFTLSEPNTNVPLTLIQEPFTLYLTEADDGYHTYSGPNGTGVDFGQYGPVVISVYGYANSTIGSTDDIIYKGNGVYKVAPGTDVALFTTPAGPCYELDSWSNGAAVNAEGTQTVTVDGDMDIEAVFAAHIYAGDTTAVEYDQFSWYEHADITASTDTLTHLFQGAAQNGCDSVVTLHLTILSSEGIDGVVPVRFTIAPNPVMDGQRVSVTVDGDMNDARLTVFDAQGRRLEECRVADTYEVNLSAGIYMLRLTTADGRTATRQLVVR